MCVRGNIHKHNAAHLFKIIVVKSLILTFSSFRCKLLNEQLETYNKFSLIAACRVSKRSKPLSKNDRQSI